MRFLVQIPDLDGFLYGSHREADLASGMEKFQRLRSSGLLLDGGLFADDRGGFLVVEMESQDEAETYLAGLFGLDRGGFQVHPILSLGQMGELFTRMKKEGPKAAKVADGPKGSRASRQVERV